MNITRPSKRNATASSIVFFLLLERNDGGWDLPSKAFDKELFDVALMDAEYNRLVASYARTIHETGLFFINRTL